MDTIPVPRQLMQVLLNYLDTRPHGEVRALVDELIKLAHPPAALEPEPEVVPPPAPEGTRGRKNASA